MCCCNNAFNCSCVCENPFRRSGCNCGCLRNSFNTPCGCNSANNNYNQINPFGRFYYWY